MNRFADRRVTIADVALHACVSKTTVSHVLSGRRPVAAPTRERVEISIRELGYRPMVWPGAFERGAPIS